MESKDLELTRPVDCTQGTSVPDDAVPTFEGLALKHYGKPFGQLERKFQTMIRAVVEGNRRELEAMVKSLKRNNLLSAEQKKARMHDAASRVDALHDAILDDVEDFVKNGDDMDVTLNPEFKKNKSGSVRAKLRTLTAVERLNALRLRNQMMMIEMEREEQPKNVNITNDNRTQVLNADSVKERLGKFGGNKGEIVDQAGDGSDS